MVDLSKGGKVSLEKVAPGLKKFLVGLQWDVNRYDGGAEFDLDASAFVTKDGKVVTETDFVFYRNPKHPSGAVWSTGDNRTGEGDGDDEQILVDLDKVPAGYNEIYFTITIYDAEARSQNFGQVENAMIHLTNPETGEDLVKYDLSEDFSAETAIVAAKLYLHNGEWKFAAIGQGFTGGLAALCNNFGISVK